MRRQLRTWRLFLKDSRFLAWHLARTCAMEFEASHVGKRAAVWAYAWRPHCLHVYCRRSGHKVNRLYHKRVFSCPLAKSFLRQCSLKLSVACWLPRATIPAVCPGCDLPASPVVHRCVPPCHLWWHITDSRRQVNFPLADTKMKFVSLFVVLCA